MSKKTNQSGARKKTVRPVFVVILILAILGAAGYFIWANYIQKNNNGLPTVAVTTKTKTFTYNKLSLSFKYPSNWTLANNTKSLYGKVVSPDGNLALRYEIVAIDPNGGSCSLDSPGDSYTVAGLSSQSVPSTSGIIFRQLSTKYTTAAGVTTYSYKFGLATDTDNSFKNGKVGDFVCNVDKTNSQLLAKVQGTDGSTYYLAFSGSFKDLDSSGPGLTQAKIDKAFASPDAKTARDILKSASIK